MIHEHRLAAASNPSRRGARCDAGLVFALLIAVQGALVAVDAEPLVETPQNAAEVPAQKTHVLRITKEGATEVSLNAEGARLSEIAADLSKRLNAWVIVGPTIEKESITVNFSQLPLEPALSALAPRVFIDYEIRRDAQPAPKGIYLLNYADPEPALNAVVRGRSQGLLITGNTEDTGKSSPDDPLQILGDKNRLSIMSKQQPLSVVVAAIAETLGVSAEFEYDSAEIVDTDIRDAPPEDAIIGLSPNIRLYVRVDVNRFQRTPLRLVVVPPGRK